MHLSASRIKALPGLLVLTGLINLFFLNPLKASVPKRDSITVSGFGQVKLFKPATSSPNKVIICISGDGGWNTGIENIALHLWDNQTLLMGVDIRKVLKSLNSSKSACLYPAADFERMSQSIQKKLGYKTYNVPVLLGYSSGATLVYGLLAQAPENTFKAGIVLGFCPDFDIRRPLCQGSGKFTQTKRKDGKGYDLGAAKSLSVPFISLQGQSDKICNYASTLAFLKGISGAKVVSLPNVGHGYGTEKNWLPQLLSAYTEVSAEKTAQVLPNAIHLDLPLHVTAAEGKQGDEMLVFISGDGGWTGFDQQTVNAFARRGIPVIGLDALKYFWEKKSPGQLSADIASIIKVYSQEWKKDKIILVGYSFGADVMAFALNRLPPQLKSKVTGLGLLSPSKETDLEIHVADLLNFSEAPSGMSVPAEINRVENIRPICFFGKEETDTPVAQLNKQSVKLVYLDGGHHYTNAFDTIAQTLLTTTK